MNSNRQLILKIITWTLSQLGLELHFFSIFAIFALENTFFSSKMSSMEYPRQITCIQSKNNDQCWIYTLRIRVPATREVEMSTKPCITHVTMSYNHARYCTCKNSVFWEHHNILKYTNVYCGITYSLAASTFGIQYVIVQLLM